jgi:hypothetical protein
VHHPLLLSWSRICHTPHLHCPPYGYPHDQVHPSPSVSLLEYSNQNISSFVVCGRSLFCCSSPCAHPLGWLLSSALCPVSHADPPGGHCHYCNQSHCSSPGEFHGQVHPSPSVSLLEYSNQNISSFVVCGRSLFCCSSLCSSLDCSRVLVLYWSCLVYA